MKHLIGEQKGASASRTNAGAMEIYVSIMVKGSVRSAPINDTEMIFSDHLLIIYTPHLYTHS